MDPFLNRIGRFHLDEDLVRRHASKLGPVFRDIVVVWANQRFDTLTIEYLALGLPFEVVPTGTRAPEYTVDLTYSDEGSITGVRFHRI